MCVYFFIHNRNVSSCIFFLEINISFLTGNNFMVSILSGKKYKTVSRHVEIKHEILLFEAKLYTDTILRVCNTIKINCEEVTAESNMIDKTSKNYQISIYTYEIYKKYLDGKN